MYTIKSLWFYWIHFTSTIFITFFVAECVKNKVIDRYIHCLCRILNTHADLNIGHCVEFTFFECKLGGFLVKKILKSSLELKQNSSEMNILPFSFSNAINFKNVIIKILTEENYLTCPKWRWLLHNDIRLYLLEKIYKSVR